MFGPGSVQYAYPRPRRRRGWGRIVLVAAALAIVTGRVAYGSGPVTTQTVVVAPGDTVWSIAASHFAGDPRPHVEAILLANHLRTPILTPGESLRLPQE